MLLRKNSIELHDSWVWPDTITYTGDFYNFVRKIESKYHIGLYSDGEELNYYRSVHNLQPTNTQHTRQFYNMMDLIGDLGGVMDIIIMLFGLVLYPYASYSYNLEMQRCLYKARTNDNKMFKPVKEQEKKPKTHFHITKKMKLELSKHHSIVLKPLDKAKLFLSQYGDFFCFKTCWQRKNKFMKLYEEGVAKIENDLNVFKLLSNVKTMKAMLKN